MAHMIVQHTDFDASSVKFSDLRKNKMGGKAVYISNANTGKKMVLQLPKLRAPFGMSRFDDQNSGKSTFSLDLSLDDEEIRKKFEAVDDSIVKLVAANSKAWLGKAHSATVVRDVLYKPIVKPASDEKYAPTMKLKVLVDAEGNFVPEGFNSKREPIDLNSIEKGQSLYAIVHVSQIWIIDNKCGVTLRLEQLMTLPTDKIRGFAFKLDEGEIEEAEEEEEYEDEEEDIIDE